MKTKVAASPRILPPVRNPKLRMILPPRAAPEPAGAGLSGCLDTGYLIRYGSSLDFNDRML